MITRGLTPILPTALGAILHAKDHAAISPVIRKALPFLTALQERGFGTKVLGEAMRRLATEPGEGEYSWVAVNQLQKALEGSDILKRLGEAGDKAEEFFEDAFPPEDLAAKAAELERLLEGIPAEARGPTVWIKRGFPVTARQTVTTLGTGADLTCRGGTRATRAAHLGGPYDTRALAHLGRDLGVVNYAGRDSDGAEQWTLPDGTPITEGEIRHRFGDDLIDRSGIRPLPLGGKGSQAERLPAPYGGGTPGDLIDTDALKKAMGLHPSQLAGTVFGNQVNHMRYAGRFGALLLYSALEAILSLGGTYPDLYPSPYRQGIVTGHAYPGLDRWHQLFEMAARGEAAPSAYTILSALDVSPNGLFKTLVAPRFSYEKAGGKLEPEGLEKIIPKNLASCRAANTFGPNFVVNGACATAIYALAVGAMLLQQGLSDMEMIACSDGTFAPLNAPAVMAGFGPKAPITIPNLVNRLIAEGMVQPIRWEWNEKAEEFEEKEPQKVWDSLPPSLQKLAIRRASAPMNRHAGGLVMADGTTAFPLTLLWGDLLRGQFPSTILAAWSVGAGEGGNKDNAGMSQGGVSTTKQALEDARKRHNAVPNVTFLHGTSTRLFNVAEIAALSRALAAEGITGMILSAAKALTGHPMGIGIEIPLAIQSLMEQRTPRLMNFDPRDIDPRIPERVPTALKQMVFDSGVFEGPIPAILVQLFGFGDMNGSAVFKHVPQDVDAAAELWRDYHAPEWLISRWRDLVGQRREFTRDWTEKLLRGQVTRRDIAAAIGYQ